MKLTKEDFCKRLILECNLKGICITENVALKLYAYNEILQKENENINLTAIVDDEEVIIKHFVDCLELTKEIDYEIKKCKGKVNLLDVGTGAGFPGAVLAIYYNNTINITLADALNKRIEFLNREKEELGLMYDTLHARAEEMGQGEGREKFDIVVSRAVAPLNILVELTAPLAKENGICIYMKSGKYESEISDAENAIKAMHLKDMSTRQYELSIEKDMGKETLARTIIVLQKKGKVDSMYPRQYGKIKNKPI